LQKSSYYINCLNTSKIRKQFRLIEKLLITILIYNNFDYIEDRKDKKISKIKKFKSITTALIFKFYKSNLILLRKKI